jgi:hypothetical protein
MSTVTAFEAVISAWDEQVRDGPCPADRKPFPAPGGLWLLGYYSEAWVNATISPSS